MYTEYDHNQVCSALYRKYKRCFGYHLNTHLPTVSSVEFTIEMYANTILFYEQEMPVLGKGSTSRDYASYALLQNSIDILTADMLDRYTNTFRVNIYARAKSKLKRPLKYFKI